MSEKNSNTIESSRVAVMRSGGEYTLISREPVSAGTRLFVIEGELTEFPTRYSLQVGHAVHLDIPDTAGHEEIMDRFYWRFTNHSCEPNSAVRDRELIALRDIEQGEEITFHYNTTEYEMAEPFDCRCGSGGCDGRIQGFRFLSQAERERLRPWLADHLLSLPDDEATTASTTEGHYVVQY